MLSKIVKAKWLYVTMSLLIFGIMLLPKPIQAETFQTKAESAIIVDADTGKILYGKDKNNALPPASMTKMMTEYIVLDQINNGKLSWDDEIAISDFVYEISKPSNGFSGIGLRQNVTYTVKDLYDAMAINSDNGTTIALAEHISGSEGEFVKLMNETGEAMQLPEFKFVNSTGLDNALLDGKHPEGTEADDTNLLSAESAALLAYHLVNDYPEVLEVSSIPEKIFEDQEIRNYNWMLKHDTSFLEQFYYEGLDGLKTGHTDLAGYTFTSTAERDGRRLITVVMKTESEAVRFQETAKLLDYGFNQFDKVDLFAADYSLDGKSDLPVAKGKEDSVKIGLEEGISEMIKNGSEENYSIEYKIDESLLDADGKLIAPIKKGEIVGKAELIVDEKQDYGYILEELKDNSVNLVATEDVEKKNWFSLMLSGIGSFFSNLYHKVIDLF